MVNLRPILVLHDNDEDRSDRRQVGPHIAERKKKRRERQK
jgi:hypothetical protein